MTPTHRENFTHKTKKEYCFLSTELLFEDSVIPLDCQKFPTPFDKTVFTFSGNKAGFASKIETNKRTVKFDGFKPTFELINKIVNDGI